MDFLCEKERTVYFHWKQHVMAEPFPEYLFWRVSGCKIHQKMRPCGNKEERGVPFGASCLACPLDNEVGKYISGKNL